MSDYSQSQGSTPNLVLTPEEKKVFGQLFQAADTQNLGVITGELAVKFFEKSGLKPLTLGEIWGIADTDNRGLLTKVGFSVALRLIGQAQAGQPPSASLALQPGPLPTFKGVTIAYPSSPQPQQSPTSPIQRQISGSAVVVPRLSPEDVARYTDLFEKSGPVDGVLSGENARQIFQKAKLLNSTLGIIWSLADRQQRGALGPAEFVIAMHLIQCTMNGSLPVLPTSLPPTIFEAAAGRPPRTGSIDGRQRPLPGSAVSRQVTGQVPIPPIPKQFSGSINPQRAQSPLRRQFTPTSGPPPQIQTSNDVPWVINQQDKAKFDAYFTEVDSGNKGFITGEEAVPFFSGSKLPEDALAQIWDLADIQKNGTLTREEFAIAMYLIRMERTKGTNGKGLPDTLPVAYIPPNMRAQLGYGASPQIPQSNISTAFEPAPPVPEKKSTYDDLFGLEDSFSSNPTAPVLAPTKTGPDAQGFTPFTSSSDLFGGPNQKEAVASGSPAPPAGIFASGGTKPFIPSSSFGQSILAPNMTGGSSSSLPQNRGVVPTQANADDLLGDNDPEVSRKLTSESTELANLSNQIGSLTKQTQDLRTKRASAEQNLTNVSAQKQEIEAKLSALRQQYEKEEKDVRRVEEQLAISKGETTRLRNDYALIEASLTDLRTRRTEVDTAYQTDQQENNSLKERMKVVNNEINTLKPELEKLRSDARQQKGLVAISKKQLSTAESERDKVKSDIEVERKDLAATQELLRRASPAPPASPTLSQTSAVSNNPFSNPFHRKSPPPAQDSAFSPSPFAPSGPVPQSQSAFENVFGSSFTGANAPTSAPAVTFHRQDTGGTRELAGATAFSGSPAVSEGGIFGGSTPPTSPPTSSYSVRSEAPPPSATGPQMTSAYLPLQVTRADSMTSSIQVQPSDAGVSRPETPTAWVDAREEPRIEPERTERDTVKPSPLSQSANTMMTDTMPIERNLTGSTTGGNPSVTRPAEKRSSFSSNIASGSSMTNVQGADAPGPIKPTPTGESYMSNISNMSHSSQSKPLSEFGTTRHDPFSFAEDDGRTPPASKDDFDAAFAGFEPSKGSEKQSTEQRGLAPKHEQEFPPIEEHFSDDSSDSSHRGGFEDDFTPTQQPRQELHAPDTASHSTYLNATAIELPKFSQPSGPGTPLPGPNAQASPPPYQASPGLNNETNPFPPEFTNLLPQRGDPTKSRTLSESSNSGVGQQGVSRFMSSPAGTPTQVKSPSAIEPTHDVFAHSVSDPAHDVFVTPQTTSTNTQPMQNTYASAPTHQLSNQGNYEPFSASPVNTAATQQPVTSHDDFDDDDFADLADAREGDLKEEGVDDFKHHNFDDFNPVFDSPGPTKATTTTTNTVAPRTYDVGTAFGGDNNFDNFHSNAGTGQGYTQAASTSHFAPQTQTSSNEWDALFANLDDNKPSQPQLPGKEPLSPNAGPSAMARNLLLNGRTTDVTGDNAVSNNNNINNNNDISSFTSNHNENTPTVFPGVPPPSGTVVKEDAKLHELQDMGFDENKATQALKKFNGNLGEATNYLLDMPTTPRE